MTITKKYVVIIGFTCLLIIINQLIIQYAISQKSDDAFYINISGKQRMLSQKIIALVAENKEKPNKDNYKKLENTFNEWEKVHYGFQYGNKDIGLEKLTKENISLVQNLNIYVENAREVIKNSKEKLEINIEELAKNQNLFLVKMDKIVKKLEADSDKRLQFIKYIEIFLALITLLVLLVEVIFVFIPITKNLQKQNSKLLNTNKTLEEYNYVASHDLRTPIINILSFAKLLKNQKGENIKEDEKTCLDFIIKGAKEMDNMTNDLMHFSLIKEVNKEKVNIIEIIKSIEKELEIENEYELTINEIPKEIEADKQLIKIVIKNIIENAIKFIEINKMPTINVSGKANKKQYKIIIEDKGIGIEEKDKEKIFGIYKRLNNKQTYKGSGIGLAIAKKIIDLHEGEIWVESQINEGTKVFITLPKS